MKKFYLIGLLFCMHHNFSLAQTLFYRQNFDNTNFGCLLSTNSANWQNISIGTQGTNANDWYIYYPVNSDTTIGCDSANTNTSTGALYIGYGGGCDSALSGAKYRKGCQNETCKRAQSQRIDCTGGSNFILYMRAMGQNLSGPDYCAVMYSPDDGSTWDTLYNHIAMGYCYGNFPNGYWGNTSFLLPPSAANNKFVKIGFVWTNNDDCNGTYVSVAIDDILLVGDTCGFQLGFPEVKSWPDTICEPAPIDVTILCQPSNPLYTYQWYINGTLQSGTSANLITSEPSGQYTVEVIVSNGTCKQSYKKEIYVQEELTAILTTSNRNICINDCIDLTATPSIPSPNYTYSWDFINAIPSNSSIQNPTGICFDNPGESIQTVHISNGACPISDTIIIHVAACERAYATSISTTTSRFLCESGSVSFSNVSFNVDNYYWSFPGGSPSFSTSPTPTVSYSSLGTYDYYLIVSNTPFSDTIFSNDLNNILVLPNPVITTSTWDVANSRALLTLVNASAYLPYVAYLGKFWIYDSGTSWLSLLAYPNANSVFTSHSNTDHQISIGNVCPSNIVHTPNP